MNGHPADESPLVSLEPDGTHDTCTANIGADGALDHDAWVAKTKACSDLNPLQSAKNRWQNQSTGSSCHTPLVVPR